MPHDPCIDLLQRLVRSPSISGNEAEAVQIYADFAQHHGFTPHIDGRNVYFLWHQTEGPTLLLNSHLDTVRASTTWTRDPWDGAIEEDRLHGLGANDAKGSVAAQFGAALTLRDQGFPGNLLVCASCDEETGGEGMERIAHTLPTYHAALIGEPNNFAIAAGQRGLVKTRIHLSGQRAHASRPWQGRNAIHQSTQLIENLLTPDLNIPGDLTKATLQVTLIEGGTQSNVVPDHCTITLDCRTTPEFNNERMLEHIHNTATALNARVEVISQRFKPCQTPPTSALVQAAQAATMSQSVTVFPSVCDLFWVAHVPSLVMGPGQPERSHQADEFILIPEVLRGAQTYAAIAQAWWERVQPTP